MAGAEDRTRAANQLAEKLLELSIPRSIHDATMERAAASHEAAMVRAAEDHEAAMERAAEALELAQAQAREEGAASDANQGHKMAQALQAAQARELELMLELEQARDAAQRCEQAHARELEQAQAQAQERERAQVHELEQARAAAQTREDDLARQLAQAHNVSKRLGEYLSKAVEEVTALAHSDSDRSPLAQVRAQAGASPPRADMAELAELAVPQASMGPLLFGRLQREAARVRAAMEAVVASSALAHVDGEHEGDRLESRVRRLEAEVFSFQQLAAAGDLQVARLESELLHADEERKAQVSAVKKDADRVREEAGRLAEAKALAEHKVRELAETGAKLEAALFKAEEQAVANAAVASKQLAAARAAAAKEAAGLRAEMQREQERAARVRRGLSEALAGMRTLLATRQDLGKAVRSAAPVERWEKVEKDASMLQRMVDRDAAILRRLEAQVPLSASTWSPPHRV